jgi:hypothetical protein
MSLLDLASWIVAALAGALAHELAHWVVWSLTGRRPTLDIWGLVVIPHAGPPHTTTGDRVAAAAPYLLGAVCVLVGLQSGAVLVTIAGLACIQIPSRADIETMRGRATWAGLLDAEPR